MTKRIITSLMMALVLVASMAAGTVVSGAQQPPDLTKSYSWQSHGMSVAYPSGWSVTESDTAVRLRPDGLDVSDGFGPELVLFEQPDTTALQFEPAIADLAASFGATSTITARTSLNGNKTIRADLTWSDPAASGELMLIAVEEQNALGAAYVVRDSADSAHREALSAMFDSIVLGVSTSVSSSSSVASVELSQPYLWDTAGLALYFPADWDIEFDSGVYGNSIYATPQNLAHHMVIHATAINGSASSLSAFNNSVEDVYGEITGQTATTIAGYESTVYDLIDSVDGDELTIRMAVVDVKDRDLFAILIMVSEASYWNDFRPTVSAFISSVEAVSAPEASLSLVANTAPLLGSLPQQTEMQEFVWEEYGVTLSIPVDWQSLGGSQDYDLALVSPEALTSGTGPFLIFDVYPSLGTGATVESAVQSVASDSGGEVKEFAPNGYGVNIVDEASGLEQNLILYPYNNHGAALFVQTSTLSGDTELIAEILTTLVITPPSVDYDAADAAFQASLEESGSLSYGDADAPVQVAEYFSFTCGHCANYTLPMQNFVALDVETGNARLAIAPLASSDDAKAFLATHAMYCAAEQGKGYSVYEALFGDYLTNGYSAAYTEESVGAILAREEFGLDLDQVNACIESEKYAPVLATVSEDFIGFGLSGTPTVVMGAHGDDMAPIAFPDGSIWSGTMDINALRTIVSSAIENDISTQDAANLLFES